VSDSLQQLAPWLYPWAVWLHRQYPYAQVTSVFRSTQAQAQLYTACSHGGCRYPVAPPGQSMHGRRRAWDMVAPAAVLAELGRRWEAVGGTWGGRFGDSIHFEA
jgi:hypothetical protein